MNYDWLTSFFKHGASLPKQKHEDLIVYVFKESVDPDLVWRLRKYHIWCFGPIFQILGTNNVPIKQIMAWLFYRKKVIMILPTKTHINLWGKLKIIWKNPNDVEKLHPDFSEVGKEERQLGMLVFFAEIYNNSQNIWDEF